MPKRSAPHSRTPQDHDDRRWMRRALMLAKRGIGFTEPNPAVGCVIVKHSQVIGQGYHACLGGPHAEIEALADARNQGHDVAGATVYVTLEPCSHHGKTPPCADALIAAQVRCVVCATIDEAPHVNGSGIAKLREAGVEVRVGVLAQPAQAIIAPFRKCVATGLPYVTAKWAQTLDGKIATSTGDSQWISGPASRRMVHRLRARMDVVMVGINTVMADNPRLDARDVAVRRMARAVVIDPRLRIPLESQLVQNALQRPLTVYACKAAIQEKTQHVDTLRSLGVEVVAAYENPCTDGNASSETSAGAGLNMREVLLHLQRNHQTTNVLAEGGQGLLGGLIAEGLVDRALVFVAPRLLGDAKALGPVGLGTRQVMAEALQWTLMQTRTVGDGDVLLDYRCHHTA